MPAFLTHFFLWRGGWTSFCVILLVTIWNCFLVSPTKTISRKNNLDEKRKTFFSKFTIIISAHEDHKRPELPANEAEEERTSTLQRNTANSANDSNRSHYWNYSSDNAIQWVRTLKKCLKKFCYFFSDPLTWPDFRRVAEVKRRQHIATQADDIPGSAVRNDSKLSEEHLICIIFLISCNVFCLFFWTVNIPPVQ